MICTHHISRSSTKIGSFCEGRITLRFIQKGKEQGNVLRISSFTSRHSNHPSMGDARVVESLPPKRIVENLPTKRDEDMNQIMALLQQMPDDAVSLAKETLEGICEKWNGDNHGLEVHLIEKTSNTLPMVNPEPQMLVGKYIRRCFDENL